MDLQVEGQADASRQARPVRAYSLSAGFQNPADDHLKPHLSLDDLAIQHSASSYFARCETNAMQSKGAWLNDIVIIDHSLTPTPGQVVVAVVNGEFHLRRYESKNGKPMLVAANRQYEDIPLTEPTECF